MSIEAEAIAKDAIRTLRSAREALEFAVELLIALLDQIDGDPDRELDDPVEETDPLEPEDGI